MFKLCSYYVQTILNMNILWIRPCSDHVHTMSRPSILPVIKIYSRQRVLVIVFSQISTTFRRTYPPRFHFQVPSKRAPREPPLSLKDGSSQPDGSDLGGIGEAPMNGVQAMKPYLVEVFESFGLSITSATTVFGNVPEPWLQIDIEWNADNRFSFVAVVVKTVCCLFDGPRHSSPQ